METREQIDSQRAGVSGPGTPVSLSWDLAKQKMLFQGLSGSKGPWAGGLEMAPETL